MRSPVAGCMIHWTPSQDIVHAQFSGFLHVRRLTCNVAGGLQVVEFADVMTARHLLFWRIVFEELLQTLDADSAVQEVFSKFGGPGGALSAERADLTAFLRRRIGPWLARKHTEDDVLLGKLRAAEMGLSAAANRP